jgi:hypothetical protein
MKHFEDDPFKLERSPHAHFHFRICIHGDHPWEMTLEDKHHYHGISRGFAADEPEEWQKAVAPVLKQFFRSCRDA